MGNGRVVGKFEIDVVSSPSYDQLQEMGKERLAMHFAGLEIPERPGEFPHDLSFLLNGKPGTGTLIYECVSGRRKLVFSQPYDRALDTVEQVL